MHTEDDRSFYVIVDGEKVRTDLVEVTDIEEDMLGRDLATFVYKGKTYQSYVVG